MKSEIETLKPTILYVDDDMENLTSFKSVFRRSYKIFLASSAKEAIEILRANKIMVLITDQRMPEMTGSDLLAIAALEYPDTLRFLLTGFTDYNPLVDAINKGKLHGYFAKPFDAECISTKINKNLKTHYLELENNELLKKLQQNEHFLDAVIESIPHMICVKEAQNLSIVRVNLAAEEILGYKREELIGKTDYDIFPKEEAESLSKIDKQVLTSGRLLD
ncbi:MAG: response regulator, partial [Desulfamplus sp.]|nr:response regulator [Desulfamplus sp.]